MLKFVCNNCPAEYKQFKELVEHYEEKHTGKKLPDKDSKPKNQSPQ